MQGYKGDKGEKQKKYHTT